MRALVPATDSAFSPGRLRGTAIRFGILFALVVTLAASIARDYATLIAEKGWLVRVLFRPCAEGLWTEVPLAGPGMSRKRERRFALSGEYGITATYDSLIRLGTSSAYEPDRLSARGGSWSITSTTTDAPTSA
jgi:hypothetical protein